MKLTHSLPAKILAIFLLLLVLIGTTLSAAVIAADAYLGVYTGDYAARRQELREDALREIAYTMLHDFRYGKDLDLLYADASFFYSVVCEETGEVLFASPITDDVEFSVSVTRAYADEPLGWTAAADTAGTDAPFETIVPVDAEADSTSVATAVTLETTVPVDVEADSAVDTTVLTLKTTSPVDEPEAENFTYTVTLYAKKTLPEEATDRFALLNRLLDFIYRFRYGAIALSAVGVLLFFTLLIFLYCSAGHRRGEDEARENFFDRIPFDLFTVLIGGAVIALGYLVMQCLYAVSSSEILWLAFAAAGCVLIFLLCLFYTMSIATRVKSGRLFRNTVLWRVLALCGRALRGLFSLLGKIPMVWKTVLGIFVCGLIELIVLFIARYDFDSLFINWFFSRAVLSVLILHAAVSLRRLQKAGEQIAAGNLGEPVDTRGMIGDFKRFGSTLGSIGDGLSHAVDERMKSERMKTELITNVSHDIKTPLTSIINYVDLLKKEEAGSENETVRQYLDTLDRQSTRLKKLIEDLVEASKASTGNLSVELAPCEIGILLEQTVGEYTERLEASGLTPILTLPETPVFIYADGRRMWRVFDNLMNNICKYAQSGTRVYLELAVIGSRVVITFKNISKERLAASGEELTERFVRGDSSRNTEGSGLGLSIAQSLTELQGGRLMITTDGDLFKAMISFDVYTEQGSSSK